MKKEDPPLRSIVRTIQVAKVLNPLNRKGTEYEERSREEGVAGLTVFYILYRLYGFNFLHDACCDGMHTPCNECKQLALYYVSGIKSHQPGAGKESGADAAERNEMRETYVNSDAMLKKLDEFPLTPEMRASRFPTTETITGALGFWKMEEYKHFGFPLMSQITADGVLRGDGDVFTSQERYKTTLALSEIIRIHYYGGRSGWTKECCEYYRRLLRYYMINRGEDPAGGLSTLTINMHSMHTFILQVTRWGEVTNSSCWGRERKVKEFTEVPHNGKNLALSMTISAVVAESLEFDRDRVATPKEIQELFKDPVSY